MTDPEYLLIDRILAGEHAVYAEMVNRYKSYVFTIAFKVLQVRPDAEEASQDTFVKAFHGLKGFNRDSRFSTWLYRIAFNTSISYKRKQRQKFQSIADSLEAPGNDTEGGLESTDKKKFLHQALARLSEADRIALTLFCLDEFSLDEIASITGIAANTIKVRIHRARLRMAEELKDILNEEALTL